MNFTVEQNRFRQIAKGHPAWKLLRARHAPTVLAFIAAAFAEKNELPYGQARLLLEDGITRNRETGFWDEGETPAATYLNEWIKEGWLREMDDVLMPTDAADQALRFVRSLQERQRGTTASRLRLVQEAVRDFAAAVDDDTERRIAVLQRKKAEIEQEIAQIADGSVPEYSANRQAEMLEQIYDLASGLTTDFRFMEDEIRRLDRLARIRILKGGYTRGQVLQTVFEREKWLDNTSAGDAFNSFFELLCHPYRSGEFREQLEQILANPAAQHLSPVRRLFLSRLLSELNGESKRVFRIRRRTEQELRAYVKSGMANENQAVDGKIRELERLAMLLREQNCRTDTPTALSLNVGSIAISSPNSMKLRQASSGFQVASIEEHPNSCRASEDILKSLDNVQIRPIALALQTIIRRADAPQTLSSLSAQRPIQLGLEELVAYYRVLRAVLQRLPENRQNDLAAHPNCQEEITIHDQSGRPLRVQVPLLTVSPEQFPDQIDELAI